MRFTRVAALSMVAVLLTAGAIALAPRPASASPPSVRATWLFDLGDGSYAWVNASIPNPTASNATWNATLAAASSLDLWVSWTWFPCCGVFITDLGNRSPPSGGVGVFLWNATGGEWELASTGISSLVLRDGDAIALSDNAFDPVTYATLAPVPTPDHPYPATGFRGDAANSGAFPSSAPDGVSVRWDQDLHLQEIPSSPAVAYGRAYILTLDGLFALDESTGAVAWSDPAIQGLSSPAVFNDTLILGGRDGKVHAVDAGTGREVWNTTLVPHPVFSGITSSPKIVFDTVYLGTFNETGGTGEVVALWATNGTVQWRRAAPGSVSYSSPGLWGGTLYVGVIGKYNTTTQVTYDPPYGLLALDAASGAERWFAPTDGPVAASPVVVDPLVIVPSKDGHVYAWDASGGSLAWKTAVSAGVSSPAAHDGTLYVGGGSFGSGGRVVALDASTGAVRWSATPNGPVQSSIVYANGILVFSTNTANGTVYAIDAVHGDLVWSYTPSPAQYIFGTPAVADGRVYAPSDNGHVYAIESPRRMVTLRVDAPSAVGIGQNVTLTATVTSVAGRVLNATLRMGLPGFRILTSSASYTPTSTASYEWPLGAITFGENRTVTLHAEATCLPRSDGSCGAGTANGTASVVTYGVNGLRHEDAVLSFNVGVTAASAPSSLDGLYFILPVVVALFAMGAALYIARQRRPRHGP